MSLDPLSSPDIIRLEFGTIQLRQDGFVQIDIFENSEINLEETKLTISSYMKLTNNKSLPTIWFIGDFAAMSKESLSYGANLDEGIGTLSNAFVMNNMSKKLIGNFYMKIFRPKKPTKIFNNEVDAVKWLSKFR